MSKPPPPIQIIYFHADRTSQYHELMPETPARCCGIPPLDAPDFRYLKDAPVGSPIEVHMNGVWARGERVADPTNYKFEVSIVSWKDETECWKALELACNKVRSQPDTPFTWMKVTPPSRR